MKLIYITIGLIIISLFVCVNIYAAPAGNTADTKTPYGDGVLKLKDSIGTVKLSINAESVIDRELTGGSGVSNAETEGEWYMLRLSYPIFENVLEPYLKLGVSHTEASWTEGGKFVLIKGDNELAWGIGAKFLAYEIPRYKVKFVIDGGYRTTEPGIVDVSVNDPLRTVSAADYKIDEWQISGIVSMEFPLGNKRNRGKSDIASLVPYVGLAYSDCDINGKFTYSGTTYDIGSAEYDTKIVLITGCDLLLPENASLNIEGRLGGETAVSGGGTVKF